MTNKSYKSVKFYQKYPLTLLALFIIVPTLVWYYSTQNAPTKVEKETAEKNQNKTEEIPMDKINYVISGKNTGNITVLDNQTPQITNLKISPNGQYLIATELSGDVILYINDRGNFKRAEEMLFHVETNQPGFPPAEAGLVGVWFDSDFENSRLIYFSYLYAKTKKDFINRVASAKLIEKDSRVLLENYQIIFEANSPGGSAHQIDDGVSLMINDKSHIMFAVGEAFDASRALKEKLEAGKLILLQSDGSAPADPRPFQNSKVQAIGIRNALAIDYDKGSGLVALGDTGPEKYDRLIIGKFHDAGKNDKKLSFNWDGTTQSLKKEVIDLYSNQKESVYYRFDPTETIVGLEFLSADQRKGRLLMTTFGQTGSKENTPGKAIYLVEFEIGSPQKTIITPLVVRSNSALGSMGHPMGVVYDNNTSTIYFGDIIEGRIYQVSLSSSITN